MQIQRPTNLFSYITVQIINFKRISKSTHHTTPYYLGLRLSKFVLLTFIIPSLSGSEMATLTLSMTLGKERKNKVILLKEHSWEV